MNHYFLNKHRIFAFKSKNEFLNFIDDKTKILVALNAEKLNRNDERLREIINQNIGYPDGIGAVWALKLKGIDSIKIPGAEFWLNIIERYQKEKSFYFVGSSEEVINETVLKLKKQFPYIDLKGFRNGFLKDEDKDALLRDFKILKPDVIFVAQGSPRQEILMEYLMKQYPATYMGLGGSFDVYCGLKKRAPKFFISLGLEWFYRLLKEPTRIKRQISLINFVYKVMLKRM